MNNTRNMVMDNDNFEYNWLRRRVFIAFDKLPYEECKVAVHHTPTPVLQGLIEWERSYGGTYEDSWFVQTMKNEVDYRESWKEKATYYNGRT